MSNHSDRRPLLSALRAHVALDRDVSEALTALYVREPDGLAALLDEVRNFARELRASPAEMGSRWNLEGWLGTLLRGPHDGAWFDTRVECGRQEWADIPPLASAVLLGRVRHGLTEMAAWGAGTSGMEGRIANALGRIFDLEMAIIVVDGVQTGGGARSDGDDAQSLAEQRGAVLAIGNALAVIETSAYLIGRYSDPATGRASDIERHLERINDQVRRAQKALLRVLEVAAAPSRFVH